LSLLASWSCCGQHGLWAGQGGPGLPVRLCLVFVTVAVTVDILVAQAPGQVTEASHTHKNKLTAGSCYGPKTWMSAWGPAGPSRPPADWWVYFKFATVFHQQLSLSPQRSMPVFWLRCPGLARVTEASDTLRRSSKQWNSVYVFCVLQVFKLVQGAVGWLVF
jgi:hypothetical protein